MNIIIIENKIYRTIYRHRPALAARRAELTAGASVFNKLYKHSRSRRAEGP